MKQQILVIDLQLSGRLHQDNPVSVSVLVVDIHKQILLLCNGVLIVRHLQRHSGRPILIFIYGHLIVLQDLLKFRHGIQKAAVIDDKPPVVLTMIGL